MGTACMLDKTILTVGNVGIGSEEGRRISRLQADHSYHPPQHNQQATALPSLTRLPPLAQFRHSSIFNMGYGVNVI